MIRRIMLALAVLGSALLATAPARAAQVIQSYEIDTSVNLSYMILYHKNAGGGSSNSYAINAPGGTLTSGFPHDSSNPPEWVSFTGVWQDSGTNHLIIALNTAFANALLGANDDFTTSFAGFIEGDLIDALILLGTPDLDPSDPGYSDQMLAKDEAFALTDAFTQELFNQGGYIAANGGTFSLLAYSTPTLVGTGTAELTLVAPIPEPGTWAMLLIGFGLVGGTMRYRRRALALAAG